MPPQRGYQIDLTYLITTPVQINGPDSGGTGFFFHLDTNSYLITAGHVLANEEREGYDEELKSEIQQDPPELSYYLRDIDEITNVSRFTVDLSADHRIWGFDPNGADVAAIQIDENLSPLTDFIDSDEDDHAHQYGSFSLMDREFIGNKRLRTDRVFTVGYPGRLYDVQTKFPVKRNALIATPPHFDFEGEERFLTDARMDPGTSGSPVLIEASQVLHPWGEHLSQETPILLGIHSGNFPHVESPESQGERLRNTRYSDLNETWRPEAILRTIQDAVTN